MHSSALRTYAIANKQTKFRGHCEIVSYLSWLQLTQLLSKVEDTCFLQRSVIVGNDTSKILQAHIHLLCFAKLYSLIKMLQRYLKARSEYRSGP